MQSKQFMYERRGDRLLPRGAFLRRLGRHATVALALVAGSLAVGIMGYHFLEHLDWIDALLNAAMILGGMGPVNEIHTAAGKIFASIYALYSGLIVLVVAGVLFAPIFHRFLHHFHLELEEGRSPRGGKP
ncbi:MAG TPA: hypothetical protein VGL11_01590 [Candidatus Binatia bacterium]|jgi:hypothetical protein